MKPATKKERGVTRTTTKVMGILMDKHEHKGSNNGGNTGEKLGKSHEKTVCKLIYIGDDTAYDFSVGMLVNVF